MSHIPVHRMVTGEECRHRHHRVILGPWTARGSTFCTRPEPCPRPLRLLYPLIYPLLIVHRPLRPAPPRPVDGPFAAMMNASGIKLLTGESAHAPREETRG